MALATPQCEIRLRGQKDSPFNTAGIVTPNRKTYVLYPSDDAKVLTTELVRAESGPITLVVPDGNWRQAAKSVQREPILKNVPRVTLPDMGPTRYRLRHEPKAGGLGTFEAMARALRILEGEEVYLKLEALFQTMVDRTLALGGSRKSPENLRNDHFPETDSGPPN